MARVGETQPAGDLLGGFFGVGEVSLGLENVKRLYLEGLFDSVSPYDAAYVALAEALGAVLLTADGRLGRAHGPTCAIEVVTGTGHPPNR